MRFTNSNGLPSAAASSVIFFNSLSSPFAFISEARLFRAALDPALSACAFGLCLSDRYRETADPSPFLPCRARRDIFLSDSAVLPQRSIPCIRSQGCSNTAALLPIGLDQILFSLDA